MPQGLTLTLGGAPHSWHSVVGLIGWFHPDIPVPVDEPGCVPLDVAKKASKDPGCPVKLGEHSAKSLKEGWEALEDLRRVTLVAARNPAVPPDQLAANVAAAKKE